MHTRKYYYQDWTLYWTLDSSVYFNVHYISQSHQKLALPALRNTLIERSEISWCHHILYLSIVSPTISPCQPGQWMGTWLLGNLVLFLIKFPHNHLTDTRDRRKIHQLTFPNGGVFKILFGQISIFPYPLPQGAYNW